MGCQSLGTITKQGDKSQILENWWGREIYREEYRAAISSEIVNIKDTVESAKYLQSAP